MHDRLYAGNRSFRRLRNGPDATGLTEFSTNMTSITDTAFKEVMILGNEFIGEWIRLKYVDDSSVTQERVSRITAFDPTAGTITFSPAIGTVHATAATVNGEYEIWVGCHPDEADNAVNRVLENLPYKATLPVTLIPDGDMEDTNATDQWSVISVPSTFEKATAVTLFGRQNLHVVATDAADGTQSASVLVTPQEPLYLNVPVRVDNATWSISIYDETNGAAVDTVDVTDTQLLEVRASGSAPSGCNSVQAYFISEAGSDEIYIGPTCLLSGWRKRYSLDTTSIPRAEDVLSVFTLGSATGADDSDTYIQYPGPRTPIGYEVEFDERAGVPLNVVLDRYPSGRPIFMEVQARHPTVSADSTAIAADKDTVVNGALYYVETARGNEREAYRYLRTFNKMIEKQGNALHHNHRPRRIAVRM
jgi:hypothetical protein